MNDVQGGCDADSSPYVSTFIIQTGAHDLSNMPVRYLIQNPKQLPNVLDHIENILEDEFVAFNSSISLNCPPDASAIKFIRVIIVATPPFELHLTPLKYKNYHTNANIKAINSFLRYNVERIQIKYESKFPSLMLRAKVLLKFLDAFDTVNPMLFHLPAVFEREGGHYITHPDHSKFTISTPPGKVVVAKLLSLLCDDAFNERARRFENDLAIPFLSQGPVAQTKSVNVDDFIHEVNGRTVSVLSVAEVVQLILVSSSLCQT